MTSIPAWTVVCHARHCGSGSHRTVMQGHRSSLISVPVIGVPEFSAWRRGRLSSADCFKVLRVALKARTFSVRSRSTLLYLWLTIKPVTSTNKNNFLMNTQHFCYDKCQSISIMGLILSQWTFSIPTVLTLVPVIRVGLLSSSLWEATPLSGSEVWKAVLLPVVIWALVQTNIRLRLYLLVAVPIWILPATETLSSDIP